MAGYSGTPLPRKLGIKPDSKISVLRAPEGWALPPDEMPEGVNISLRTRKSDLFLIFETSAHRLNLAFTKAMAYLPPAGAIWVAWPKKSSKVKTDITEDRLREMFLPTGMVDNKVCAIDDTWSGLRFVVRREDRATWNLS